MFDKKIILLISFLLIIGSSYFISHLIKKNNDEVNIVDNSDDLNEEESVNEDAESNTSFLKYLIFFIIIIVIAIIIIFVIKKFVNNEEDDEEVEEGELYQLPVLEKKNEYESEFKDYIDQRSYALKASSKKQPLYKKNVKNLTKKIINQIKKDYKKKNKSLKGYSSNDYLVNFFYLENTKDENRKAEVFFKNNKRVREINFEKNKDIVIKLFFAFFEEIAKNEQFQKFQGDPDAVNEDICSISSFIIFTIEPFLKCVSERKEKDVRFISCNDLLNEIIQQVWEEIVKSVKIENSPLSKISNIIIFLNDSDRAIAYLSKIINQLINIYFPESDELNKNKLKVITKKKKNAN